MTLLNYQHGGYFVDLAANRPILGSNTRALERDFGWRGVCIEADPEHRLALLEERSCVVVGAAISDVPSTVGFAHRGHLGLGGLVLPGTVNQNHTRGVTRVHTVALGQVLGEVGAPATLDYLSLDVEGAEDIVMRSFPFAAYTVRTMTIERPSEALKYMLTSRGYRFLCGGSTDECWVHAKTMLPVPEERMHAVRSFCSEERHPKPVPTSVFSTTFAAKHNSTRG